MGPPPEPAVPTSVAAAPALAAEVAGLAPAMPPLPAAFGPLLPGAAPTEPAAPLRLGATAPAVTVRAPAPPWLAPALGAGLEARSTAPPPAAGPATALCAFVSAGCAALAHAEHRETSTNASAVVRTSSRSMPHPTPETRGRARGTRIRATKSKLGTANQAARECGKALRFCVMWQTRRGCVIVTARWGWEGLWARARWLARPGNVVRIVRQSLPWTTATQCSRL